MEQYKPSGKYSPVSFVYLLLVCLTLVPLLAWLYAYAVWYCPLIYINFFITIAFGALVGFSIHMIVVGSGKVRNGKMAFYMGILAGIWASYLHWAIWIDLALNAESGEGIIVSHVNYDQLTSLVFDPVSVFQLAMAINEQGLWSIFKITFSGFALGVVWFIEAAMVIVLSGMIAAQKAEKPFSEKIGKWAKEISLSPLTYPEEPALLALSEGNVLALETLGRGNKKTHHTTVTLFDGFEGNWFASVTTRFSAVDEKGKQKFEDAELMKFAVIESAMAKMLQQRSEETEPALEDLQAAQGQEPLADQEPLTTFDAENTKRVVELLAVPGGKRDERWKELFYQYILNASFASENPQVIEGPDGFSYFRMQIPESRKSFNPFSLLHIKEHVLKNGYGVALADNAGQVIWSIPHGAMVNLHLNGELFSEPEHDGLPETETLKKDTTMLTGQPAEEYFPAVTRAVMRGFMMSNGIREPKVMLVQRQYGQGVISELVFNVFAEDYIRDEEFVALMKKLQWFLPQHYVVIALPKRSDAVANMEAL